MKQGPVVANAISLIAAGSGCNLGLGSLSLGILRGFGQVHLVGDGQPGSLGVGGGPNGGVEDAAEPDDQAKDADSVHGRLFVIVGLGVQLLNSVTGDDLGKVGLAKSSGTVGHGRPGQVHDVKRDKASLQEARVGLVLLDDGQDGGDREDDAQEHVEGDEELVKPAVASTDAGVVRVAANDQAQGQDVKEAGEGEEGVEPVLIAGVVVVGLPILGPRVSKVNDENQLNQDKGQATNQTKVHPSMSKAAMRDEEGANHAKDDNHVLEAPEAILNASPRISG